MKPPRWPVWLLLLAAVAVEIVPLPAGLAPFRPPWATLVLMYWALMWPGRVGIFTAFIIGLCLDVAEGSLLGQNAFVLAGLAYVVLRFHLRMRVFPLWQLTLSVFVLLFMAGFLDLWIDGIAGQATFGPARWGPVASATLLWPLVMGAMDRVRERLERRDRSFA
jgi:rod shape-determining protein MreD